MGIFASSMMLLWGAVIAVPIILHLVRRRRRQRLSWGAMRFLKDAISQSQSRYRLWQWLLLAARLLVVAFLAIAVAQPIWRETAMIGETRDAASRLRILIVDTSSSMQSGVDQESSFQRAIEASIEVCRSAALGDAFLLIDGGLQPRAIIGRTSYQPDAVIDEIGKLTCGDTPMDLGAVLTLAGDLARQAIIDGWKGPVDVLCFSDMQEVSWGSERLDLDTTLEKYPVRYLAIDCGPSFIPANASVGPIQWSGNGEGTRAGESGVRSAPQGAVPQGSATQLDGTARWTVNVSHLCGNQAIGSGTLQLRIDGRVEQTQEIPGLRIGESLTTAWSTRFSPGTHFVEMVLEIDDGLRSDNVFGEVISTSGTTSIALLGPTEADRRFAELALTATDQGRFRIQSLPQDRLRRAPLDREAIWMLCNPVKLDKTTTEQVEQFWRSGGSVIWWLGPQWREDSVLEPGFSSVAGSDVSLGPTDWRLGKVHSAETIVLDSLQYHSPILAPFQPFPSTGLTTLPVFRWWHIDLGSDWDTAMTIRDNDMVDSQSHPLIATLEQEGSGRQVLIATPAGPGQVDTVGDELPWNAMVTWPVFLPLVQEIVRWCAVPPMGPPSFRVGDRLYGYSEATLIGKELRGPGGELVRVNGQPHQGNKVRWFTEASQKLGSYRWNDGTLTDTPATYVNFWSNEGNLTRSNATGPPWEMVRLDEISSETSARKSDSLLSDDRGEVRQGESRLPGNEIGWLFLVGAIGMLLAESVIARCVEEQF